MLNYNYFYNYFVCNQSSLYPPNYLHPILHLPHKLIRHIQISIKVKASGLVMQVGAGLAFVKQLQRFLGRNIQTFGQLHSNGANAVAHDNLLYDRRFNGVFILLLFHRKSSISVLPIVQTFHQNSRKVLSAFTMKGFVVRKYKPLYQPHALHPLVHLFVGSVQQSGGGLDASGHKSHHHLGLRYFYNILHNATFKNNYLSPQKYKSFLIQQKNRYENSWLSITLPINRTNASIFPSISLFCLAVISIFCFAVVSLFCLTTISF